jgi:hypothetical protein
MPTEYLKHTCETCGKTSYTQAANAQMQNGKLLLRCASGHQHTYERGETESLQLEADPETRASMGLTDPHP